MFRAVSGRQLLTFTVAVLAAIAISSPAGFAQTVGMVKGKVVDGEGKPVQDAKITIEFLGGVTRKHEVKSNRRGEFTQVGLPPGQYKVTAEKANLGAQSFDVRVRVGDTAEVNFVLAPGLAGPSKEELEMGAELKELFEAGVELSRAGQYDEAIAKFRTAAELVPGCFDCLYNIGFAHAQKKEYELAETAFKDALEMRPDYVEALNGLATIYNAQKKFDLAEQVSQKAADLAAGAAEAGGTGSVDALYNQGVIAWNAGRIADAKQHFQEVLQINPDHADARYQLGMALLNEGNLEGATAEFEAYLRLAPEGQYATQAKGIVATLKKQ
jgi:tetratricopeptide (TPR) repeat protein